MSVISTVDDVRVNQCAVSPNGSDFIVKAVDIDDATIMDENGTWFAFSDCDFPKYEA